MKLRDYQLESVAQLRKGIRSGHRTQLLASPTGSGKTVCAGHLLKEAFLKGKRAVFAVDRVALVNQTSRHLDAFDVPHGVLQSENTRDRNAPIQIVSQQSAEKRGFWPEMDLLLLDECHALREFTTRSIQNMSVPVIGLSATPFSQGLAGIYSNLVNVTTTDELISRGYLAPIRAYAAAQIDMKGAPTVAGEWSGAEVTRRAQQIVGDIVSSWVEQTQSHFGGPVKTLVFSASVPHGEDLCKQFQAAGYNFQQVSFKDTGERRAKLIEEFRKPDSEIMGLVSVEALAKGFDVPDALCGVGARPYRKSFAGHVQQIGRVMRSHPGKEYALWLDHSGNYLGFLDRTLDLFANGVQCLSAGEKTSTRHEPTEREKTDKTCIACGMILTPEMLLCPACGKSRSRRQSKVVTVPGELEEVKTRPSHLRDRKKAWRGICLYAIRFKKGDIESASRFAKAQYRNLYNQWPSWSFEPGEFIDPALESHIKGNYIRFLKRRRAA